MAKKEVHEAIDATMVPNGVKAINADSVRNLLHMMTDNAGEGGGGDGGVKVYALPPSVVFDMVGGEEVTPEIWDEVKARIEEENPDFVIAPELDAAMEEAFAANAEVYKTMLQKAKDNTSTYAVIDMGKLMEGFVTMDQPEYGSLINYSVGVLASAMAMDLAGLDRIVQFIPSSFGPAMSEAGIDNLMLVLLPNGGYIWDDAYSTVSADYSLNIPVEGATLPEGSYKEENLLIRNAGYNAVGKSIHIWNIDPSASAGTAVTSAGRYLIHEVIEFEGFLYFDGLELKKCMIDEEGNTIIAVVGSLNAPTA